MLDSNFGYSNCSVINCTGMFKAWKEKIVTNERKEGKTVVNVNSVTQLKLLSFNLWNVNAFNQGGTTQYLNRIKKAIKV